MRTTMILRDDVVKYAAELTGIKEKTALVHAALEALIQQKACERLIALGGTQPKLKRFHRRRRVW